MKEGLSLIQTVGQEGWFKDKFKLLDNRNNYAQYWYPGEEGISYFAGVMITPKFSFCDESTLYTLGLHAGGPR